MSVRRLTRRAARRILAAMDLTLDRVADLLGLDPKESRCPRRKRRRRSILTLKIKGGIDLLELARRGAAWAYRKLEERRREGTAEDPRLEAALSREGEA